MPETKAAARRRAKKLHIPVSHLVRGKTGWYIAPRSITSSKGRHTYAGLRSRGYSKARAAKIANYVEDK
jgi:hypothetical protein